MTVAPGATAVTFPELEPMVAKLVLLLLHEPPPVASLRVTEEVPAQAVDGPEIVAGKGFTVTTVFATHPFVLVNVIFAVPANPPAMIPVALLIFATETLLLDHVPALASLSVEGDPEQKVVRPVIAGGSGLTVIVVVTVQPARLV